MSALPVLLVAGILLYGPPAQSAAEQDNSPPHGWNLQLQRRVPAASTGSPFHATLSSEHWSAQETAVIVCDLWDAHHSPNATDRVNELAPRIEALVQLARQAGAVIIHSPSDCMAFYQEHPARHRAQQAPRATRVPAGIQQWCTRIPAEEQGVYPIDQSDGGEDDDPLRHAAWAEEMKEAGRNPRAPWLRQHPDVAIDPQQDYITDDGLEAWNILESRGVSKVLIVGVHVNMCVLGRPFGLRNLVTGGKHAVLVRDLTDSMYNPARWPYVNHHTGTDLIIHHIEKYVCPTITSEQLLGGEPFRFQSDRRTRLAVLVAEPEYDTATSLTGFAADRLGQDFQVEFIFGSETDPYELLGLHFLPKADAALFSVRRRALRPDQMATIKAYVDGGKAMVGIRTASHAFQLNAGHEATAAEQWSQFDAVAWGGNYHGHYGNREQPRITTLSEALDHPILAGQNLELTSSGSLYRTLPLADQTTVLLVGQIDGQPTQPVAWTFKRSDGGRSFYTSLGHQDDFANPKFQRLLLRAIHWAAEQPLPPVDESNLPKQPQ